MNKNSNHTKFPVRKCLIATIVIFICALMVLGLLAAITSNESVAPYGWIFFLVWGILLAGGLIAYWVYQVVEFIKTRKDEN